MAAIFRTSIAIAAVLALGGCEQVEDKAFELKLRAYLREHPEVIREAAQKLKQKKIAAAARTLEHAQPRLERDTRDFVVHPDGHVTVVQFFDNNCLYCSNAAPEVLALIAQSPDVRFVFKDWPILDRGEDVTSQYAARAALA